MAHGVAKGDVVALMMPNRPEYLAVWLGITRAGGVVALLNTNLSGSALAHCVNIVAAKHIIVDAALIEGFSTAEPHLVAGPEFWCHGGAPEGYERLDTRIDALPDTPDPRGRTPAAHDRGPVPLHLHQRHDRPAEGREHQPLSRAGHHVRLHRRDARQARRPHL